ncbi:hypothetical protein EOD41_11255 [Mucilaginibacter limnophilus]|uniref:Uncharacterized protein n=1 Tax=Mucilaginibacter limnophilus TaxID=1932778 RepID=A0A3S2WXT4_9SPHI|nr:hypothetical protein [Mucilaginibacter limnophilus]RVU00573.1 hypothetical protein EOD41_11255 [Mucilaginibacter limnophilus]
MTSSIVEITENEYLIKLNREIFDLSVIRNILKMVEVSRPAEDDFGFVERHYTSSQTHSSEPSYFSSIEEK